MTHPGLETPERMAEHIDVGSDEIFDLLSEYRTRLISDVVTGKLDVRGVELPELDENEILEDIDIGEDTEAEELIESQARIAAIVPWYPQVFVDAHEMGAFSTYLFNPPREPINPNLNAGIRNWWGQFAQDQASAFDE